ncbi:hypothetical protein [Salibacterium halotolerans]|uniref:hypothetical protein n=1 Tax=Salibacterium halotolerans TaxID=1884432 RepID=UPI0011141D2B|nr:hypothetical protein [Salibacterium halotolerans]
MHPTLLRQNTSLSLWSTAVALGAGRQLVRGGAVLWTRHYRAAYAVSARGAPVDITTPLPSISVHGVQPVDTNI